MRCLLSLLFNSYQLTSGDSGWPDGRIPRDTTFRSQLASTVACCGSCDDLGGEECFTPCARRQKVAFPGTCRRPALEVAGETPAHSPLFLSRIQRTPQTPSTLPVQMPSCWLSAPSVAGATAKVGAGGREALAAAPLLAAERGTHFVPLVSFKHGGAASLDGG